MSLFEKGIMCYYKFMNTSTIGVAICAYYDKYGANIERKRGFGNYDCQQV